MAPADAKARCPGANPARLPTNAGAQSGACRHHRGRRQAEPQARVGPRPATHHRSCAYAADVIATMGRDAKHTNNRQPVHRRDLRSRVWLYVGQNGRASSGSRALHSAEMGGWSAGWRVIAVGHSNTDQARPPRVAFEFVSAQSAAGPTSATSFRGLAGVTQVSTRTGQDHVTTRGGCAAAAPVTRRPSAMQRSYPDRGKNSHPLRRSCPWTA